VMREVDVDQNMLREHTAKPREASHFEWV
jgi:hypothetical protein